MVGALVEAEDLLEPHLVLARGPEQPRVVDEGEGLGARGAEQRARLRPGGHGLARLLLVVRLVVRGELAEAAVALRGGRLRRDGALLLGDGSPGRGRCLEGRGICRSDC